MASSSRMGVPKVDLFVAFLKDFWMWTLYSLEDFEHIIPVFEEVDKSEEEGYEEKPDDEEWLILADEVGRDDLNDEDYVGWVMCDCCV